MTTTITRFGRFEAALRDSGDREALLADPTFESEALEYLEGIVDSHDVDLVSFDVFDTLLLRNDKAELTRFFAISGRLAPVMAEAGTPRTPGDLLLARLLAARVAYRTGPSVKGVREGTIGEIHTVMLSILGADPSLAADTIDVELEYERESLRPNPLLVRFAQRHRERGGDLVLISDMYLEARHIRSLVETITPALADVTIFSSAETKVSKRSGHLFDHVAETLAIDPSRCLHLGDSVVGDFRKALERGWRAVHLPIPDALRRTIITDHSATVDTLADRGLVLGAWEPRP